MGFCWLSLDRLLGPPLATTWPPAGVRITFILVDRDSHGIPMGFPWDSHGIPMDDDTPHG